MKVEYEREDFKVIIFSIYYGILTFDLYTEGG